MKIIFVRHGDPDYVNDSLTEKGWREAELLAERVKNWRVNDFYMSPLGRAKDTASCSLKKCNRKAEILDFTREFYYPIDDPVTGRKAGVPWDLVPSEWANDNDMITGQKWVNSTLMKTNPDIAVKYKEACEGIDQIVAKYGYIREGNFYRMPDKEEIFLTSTVGPDNAAAISKPDRKENEPTIVIFCHLGAICIMLSHLLNIPFPLLTHGFFLPTSSITVLSTEERWSNEAYFRVQVMGDCNHLLQNGEPISDAGYFASSFQG